MILVHGRLLRLPDLSEHAKQVFIWDGRRKEEVLANFTGYRVP
jgi:hypothetical protein